MARWQMPLGILKAILAAIRSYRHFSLESLGFGNAHPVPASRGPGGRQHRFHDHRHRYDKTRVYRFVDTATLITDFYEAVDQILKEKGIKR